MNPIETEHPLAGIGGALISLTYTNMLDFAARIREKLLEQGVIDEQLCSSHDMADAVVDAAVYMFALGDE